MADNAQIARLQSGIHELQQDLQANQKELTSKTKRIIEFENLVLKLRKTIQIKNQTIDELKVTSKLNADNKNDQMYLEMEEYKHQIQSAMNDKQRIANDYNSLQRQNNNLQLQFKSLSLKYKSSETQFTNKLHREQSMFKQQIQTMQKMHSSKLKIYKDKLDLVKKNQMVSSHHENEQIKQSLQELQESHDRIEQDLQQQIEDMRDIMDKRAKEEEHNIQEITDHYNEYKQYADKQISLLEEKLGRFQDGEVEIVLRIEVDDPILHKPPPKKPAPVAPGDTGGMPRSQSSRRSSASSHASDASHKLKQLLSLPKLFDVQSSPEFNEIHDASHPHHQISASMGMIANNISKYNKSGGGDDDDDKESKSEDGDDDNTNLQVIGNMSGITSKSNEYISPRRSQTLRRPPHIKASKSDGSSSSLSAHNSPRAPSFYIFRPKHNKANGNSNAKEEGAAYADNNDANPLISHKKRHSQTILHKKGDSGMMKDMKKFVRHAFTPKPSMTSRYGQGSGGFPNTSRNGMRNKPRTLSVLSAGSSSISSQSVFSDTRSVTSSGYGDKMRNGGTNLSRNMQLRYVKQNNTRLAEENKLLQKKIMFSKEQAHRKYKQLNTQIIAEKKQWKLKESELSSKINDLNVTQRENESLLTERYKKLQALASEYKMVVSKNPELTRNLQNRFNNNNNNNSNPYMNNNNNQQRNVKNHENEHKLILKIQSLEENNQSLAKQCEKYRRDLGGLKRTIISCNDTMKKQQQSILLANNQINELRKMNGFSGSSSEELLQKQIRLLKNQRRMLVQELKDLREQNEKLKNIIVTGSPT